MTNILVEGGGHVLGSLLTARTIDEIHAFIAGKLLGGESAATPIAGAGFSQIREALELDLVGVIQFGDDCLIHARRQSRAGSPRT